MERSVFKSYGIKGISDGMRLKPVSFRVCEEEYKLYEAAAEALGQTVSEVIRSSSLRYAKRIVDNRA